ncbi:hypothetical protein G6F46_003161 [Rhizopus delemar]|nr:hypothetical protein G6F54_002526 [Rhizopus delemar]KAG1515671.1 hypothetical protein G6F53_002749 [Rhizopus delemar]KAG1595213.1 hypothetical protein G6F48_000832 [Rhizopus delemar]KAG1604157.1 hypothetical protein G6F47_001182 [Rhizopus delemar]KAG1619450.1 hypothetical protein G6F46_003161 [Rhizopus delemar]
MRHIESNRDQHSYTDSQDVAATLVVTKEVCYSENFATKEDLIRYTVLMIGIVMAMFMMSLNSTVVAPAMSIIATELDATQSQTWIATAYLVAVNAFQPLSGKFSDIFGRKTIFLFGIILFFVGSLVNALSTNINMLIAGRTIQGFGGGGVMSMTYIIVTEVTPLALRPRFQSLLAVVYGIASVVGPLIGGAFVDHVSWHWDFWLNVILAAVSFVIILVFLKPPQNDRKTSFTDKLKRIDWLGTLFATGFIVCLLLALSWGSSYGWGSGHTIGSFVASGVSLIALIFVEGWVAKEPLLPASVMLNPTCASVYLYMICLGLTFICALYFGPTYFQAVFGADSTQSGIRLIPFMVCLITGSVASGLLVRVFPYTKYYIVVAAASNVLCYGLFYTVNENSNWGQQAGYLTFGGLAFGLSNQNAILTVQSAVELKDIAVATSCVNFFLMLASSIGVSIYQALMSTFLKAQYAHLSTDIIVKVNEYGALENYLYIRNMPVDLQKPVIHAFALAMRNLFIIPLVSASLSLIVALLFKNVRYGPSKSPSPNEENLDEKEAA